MCLQEGFSQAGSRTLVFLNVKLISLPICLSAPNLSSLEALVLNINVLARDAFAEVDACFE